MSKKETSGEDPRQEYLKELRGLLKQIDEDGLLFLIKQANTLIYNQRVDQLNQEAEALSRQKSAAGKIRKPGAEENQRREVEGISIERGAFGKSYIVDFRTVRKTFGEDEMIRLVQVAAAGESDADSAARVFRWLKRNRDDVLLDLGINTPRHGVLEAFCRAAGTTFRVRNS